ncbi:MAG TPA: four helix bundle protein [Prosthecobacter sp.]|jgi:four helix bundle protein|nr:four helix bundle protein [Prosthecobacter sp.]
MSIRRFEDIESWQMGRELSRQVYEVVRDSALGRDFSLKDQMLRSAGSIMDNIAEGFDAGSNREFVKFLQYSKRSCTELQSQLYRCLDQDYVTEEKFRQLYEQTENTKNKIGAFLQYLTRNLDHRSVGQPL